MMNNPKPISEFLVPGKRAHLVGIGGVSMCPLAEVLAGKGLLVQGSDMTESDSVKHLRSKGISARLFNALMKAGVNVRLIDQGSSELNIIVGVDNLDFEVATRAIYRAFVTKDNRW